MGLADEKILTDLKYMMKKEYGRQRLRGFKKKIGKNLGIFHTYFDPPHADHLEIKKSKRKV